MVNARLCEMARLAFFLASPETLKHFKCQHETFRLLKFGYELVQTNLQSAASFEEFRQLHVNSGLILFSRKLF